MRTNLIFNITKLIKKINSATEFYELKKGKHNLHVIKKYKNKKGAPFSINLPKEITISPEVVGLIVGEGYIGDRHFVFANSNEKAIDKVLGFLKQFDLPIKFYLEISIKGKSKKFVEDCINFWENHLKLKINKIRLRKEFYNSGNNGTIHISIYNSLVARLLNQVINISKKEIEKSKSLSVGYLKGIIAAEGNINVKKSTNCVYMVRISAARREERDHYRRCLKKAGLTISCKDMPTISKKEAKQRGWKSDKGRGGAVIISKWNNFIKIFELSLLELSDEKNQKFLKYFVNNKFTKQFLSFSNFLNTDFTMKQAQKYFGFSGRYLNRVLTLYKNGYLSRRKINKVKFMYRLTRKYLDLYGKLKFTLNNPIS